MNNYNMDNNGQWSLFGAASAKDACINLAESRQNRTQSMVNGQSSIVNRQSSIVNSQPSIVTFRSSEGRAMLASAMPSRDKIGRSQLSIVNRQLSIVNNLFMQAAKLSSQCGMVMP